jgi:signal transduction histidine kinase
MISSEKSEMDKLISSLEKAKNSPETFSFERHFASLDKYFNIEINSITNNGNFSGILILFKDITQHKKDMAEISEKQDLLIEKERLASLGQLVGGIAHNLKTPIMSIAGAAEGLTDLVKEYDSSIGDPEVTIQDHHDIAHDMNEWIEKIKTHAAYMSDIISAVKGQAVTLNEQEQDSFTIQELIKRVTILMKHELKNALIDLNVNINTDEMTILNGNVNSLVQVINNMISNAIQAYNGQTNKPIDLTVNKDNKKIIISIQDYGCGMNDEVKEKLFKEMFTTKGKNGTGLGMFMSYSTIRGHFNGNITFDSEVGKGTTFNIVLPM